MGEWIEDDIVRCARVLVAVVGERCLTKMLKDDSSSTMSQNRAEVNIFLW